MRKPAMKIKVIAKYVSAALAALVMPLTSLAGDKADIYEIFPIEGGNREANGTGMSAPLGAYETMQFTMRMLSRNWDDSMPTATDPADQAMGWDWGYVGAGSETLAHLNTPPRLGIVVSGQLRYADCVSVMHHTGNSAAFTDITWKYTVQPGDFALPAKLAMKNSTPQRPVPARLGEPGEFFVLNSTIWNLVNASNDVAVFTFCTEGTDADVKSIWARPEGGANVRDLTLETAKFFVKTVDFDEVTAATAWREVYSGITESYPAAPTIVSLDGNTVTNAVKLYAWCADESAVMVDSAVKYTGPDGVERSVYEINISGDMNSYEIPLKGGTNVEGETDLILSAYPTNTVVPYTAGDIEQNFLSRKVKCIAAPHPFMSVTGIDGKPTVSMSATTNFAAATAMKLSFSQPFTKDVEVKLEFKGGNDTTDFAANRFFTVLRTPNDNPVTQTSVDSVVMPAGQKEVVFYVYAFGANAETAAGMTVTPSVSDPDAVEFFRLGIDRQVNATVKLTDQIPAVSVNAPLSGFAQKTVDIDVMIDDNWRDLQTALNTEGYKVTVQLGSQNVLVTNGVHFTAGQAITFTVTVPAEGHPLNGKVFVVDQTHGSNAGMAEFSFDANAALTAQAVFYTDSAATNAYPSGYFYREGEPPYFRVELSSPAANDMYAFLVPLDSNASNLVKCVNVSNGLAIASGDRISEIGAMELLDGFSSLDPMRARFSVALKSTMEVNSAAAVDYTDIYAPRTVSLSVVNKTPTIVNNSVQLNDMNVANGGTMPGSVPVGVEARFNARVFDASSVDLAGTADKAIITKWQFTGPGATYTRYATNANGRVVCPFTFGDENTVYNVKIWARDKDDLAEFGDLEWGEEKYTFDVNVARMPSVMFKQVQYGEEVGTMQFEENGTKSTTYFFVELSELPTGYADGSRPISDSNPLQVELTTEAWGSDGKLEFEKSILNFNASTRSVKVFPDLNTLNGGADTLYNVTARVITDSCSNYYGQAWSNYYAASSCEMRVINASPEIVAVKRTNGTLSEVATNNCSVGESIKIHWKVADVLPDVTNEIFNVSWSIDAASTSPTANPQIITNGWTYVTQGRRTNVEGDYEFIVPDISGPQTVIMTVDDGENGTATREWTIYVAPTKRIKVNVFGPAEAAQSKYNAAKGIGQGFVAARGTSVAPLCEQFVQTWYYSETSKSAELSAWGYPSKASAAAANITILEDRGQLPGAIGSSAVGVALNKFGNKWTTGAYYDWTTMGGQDETAGDYDNFFYRWMIAKAASDGGSAAGGGNTADENPKPAPTYNSLTTTTRSFDLDQGSEQQAGVYGMVEIEAIFSRELRAKDNLGDINADGIPDVLVSMLGIGSDAVGNFPEDDLASVSAFNDDEDYLPNTDVSVYSSLIPGLPADWAAADRPFTAKMEVRGYHDGLNDAARLLGVNRARLEADYNSDDVEKRKAARDYSEVEMAAWAETGYAKEWSPERPTDPTTSDYDEDKLPDGYEYYFWYKAHVGYMENGVHKYMTGRRFNPRKPIEGDVISSKQIAQMMDPRVPAASDSLSTQDTDNDGLPDLLEFELGTNPFDFDTDGDGLPDGYEIMMSATDPLLYATDKVTPDGRRNSDGDAMAFTCYLDELELLRHEAIPTDATIVKYTSFMVETPTGEIEWRVCKDAAIAAAPLTYTDSGTAVTTFEYRKGSKWVKAAVIGATAPATVDDAGAILAADLDKSSTFEVVDGPGGEIVRQLPVALSAGTPVQNIAENAGNYADAFLSADIGEGDCNAGWLYRKDGFDYIALAAPRAVSATEPVRLVDDAAVEAEERRQVAHIHYFVYQDFGFDPRTAWNWKTPLAPRWGRVDSSTGETIGDVILLNYGYANRATRTREYTTMDEFLLMSFYLWNGAVGDGAVMPSGNVRTWLTIFTEFTTNPRGPADGELASGGEGVATAAFNTNGADTDEDGVPDGWELYVMSGPRNPLTGAYTIAGPLAAMSPSVDAASKATNTDVPYDWDDLSELQEYAGTDSCAHYSVAGNEEGAVAFSTTIVRPAEHAKWLNKFFPTDPWDADTDGDGMRDRAEFGKFVYGDPADNGVLTSIPGGGLNPLSMDTDLDGLPDPWEAQYAGKTMYEGEEGDKAKLDGAEVGNYLQGLVDGMDGTVKDAYTTPIERTKGDNGEITVKTWTVNGVKQIVNRDYDRDGLENWQEYLTAAMRAWRYDDSITRFSAIPKELYWTTDPATGELVWDPKFDKLGVADADEFWYQTLVNASVDNPLYNPNLVTDMSPSAQYFTAVTRRWDIAFRNRHVNKNAPVAYYLLFDRIGEKTLDKAWGYDVKPKKYAGCSPIKADTDQDGMDDYYELFHGMNPILGQSGVRIESDGPCDIVFDAWYDTATSSAPFEANENNWKKASDKYDFVKFPWLNGLADSDPDGDDIRNQEEAIMPKMATATWHHTDPTPVWMTDSSYTNSLVNLHFRLPSRMIGVPLDSDGFTYNEEEYSFRDFDNFSEYQDGLSIVRELAPFVPDYWSLAADGEPNWVFSFEENEGYDTDHDGISDNEEIQGKFGSASDPQSADTPNRRQAMYFPGDESALQTLPFLQERHPVGTTAYPDDLSFLQYTVECWARPESAADSTVLERAIWAGESNFGDQEYLRCNFQIAIKNGKWYTKFDPRGTLKNTQVEVVSAKDVAVGEWTHLAATYDGVKLVLYVNGNAEKPATSSLQPEYGVSAVAVSSAGAFDFARWYTLNSIVVGASFKQQADGANGGALNLFNCVGWDGYKNYFKGYIDEIRVWDGARTASEIAADVKKRYTAEDIKANRSKFCDQWMKGERRYRKDGKGNDYYVVPELRFHYAFDSIPGAANKDMIAKRPHGFNTNFKTDPESTASATRPEGYAVGWWQDVLDAYGSVYSTADWVTWVPNSVTHLPRFDATTLDSVYWSEDFQGGDVEVNKFHLVSEPVSFWTQMTRNKVTADSGYRSTGTRHFMVNSQDIGDFYRLFEFTGRHLNQYGDDMVPLGGAFVKYIDQMWDNEGASTAWEITGSDADNDGLPNWWETYVEMEGGPTKVEWNTVIEWPVGSGLTMTAGDAYLRDLAGGVYAEAEDDVIADSDDMRQSSDANDNGLPDWWEKLYGIYGADALADNDGDGLPNYVEYLLSEVFQFKGIRFSPISAYSVDKYVTDYFFKVGDLYAGEIFTDHDLVEDSWEDGYANTFASRLAYDAYADSDEDGWSNMSEARYSMQSMPIIADKQSHYSAADGLVSDYPVPTIAMTLRYTGSRRSEVSEAPIVVTTTTDATLQAEPDATFLIEGVSSESAGTGSGSASGSAGETENSNVRTRTLGKWSDRVAVGTLTPGNITAASLAFQCCYDPSSLTYTWTVEIRLPAADGEGEEVRLQYKSGTRGDYDADRLKWGDDRVELLGTETEYRDVQDLELRTEETGSVATWTHTRSGKILGTVDITTGEYRIDLGIFKGQLVQYGTNTASLTSMEEQSFRIRYAVDPSVGLPRKLYLGQATTGYVREGKNAITVFADINGDGKWQTGEPFGIVRDVDISWRRREVEVELTDTNPVFARVVLSDKYGNSEASGATDREYFYGTESSNVDISQVGSLSGGSRERVRVVRTMSDDEAFDDAPALGSKVVMDKMINLDKRGFLHEGDFLAEDEFDIDWKTLADDMKSTYSGYNYNTITYRIVLGNGVIDLSKDNRFGIGIKRAFDSEQVTPVPLDAEGIVYESSPVFKWTSGGRNTYTAFKIKVFDKSGAEVWDSGFQRMPAVDNEGNYSWTAPLYAEDADTQGRVFKNKAYYTWKVSMYNAKFRQDKWSSASAQFYMNVQENGFQYGTANVAVKYFGPAKSYEGKIVRVRAYTSPDFTGRAVASGYVALPDDAESGIAVAGKEFSANAKLIGIPAGTYYLQAFIDSNSNGVCDKWESSGYVCSRDEIGGDMSPKAIKFGSAIGEGDLAVIYLEDADTDRDGLPDAWEYALYGSIDKKGVEMIDLNTAGEFAISKSITKNLLDSWNEANVPSAGLAGVAYNSLANAGTLALALGAPLDPSTSSFAGAISGTVSEDLAKDGIRITSLEMVDGKIEIKVDAEVVAGAGTSSVMGSVVTGAADGLMTVTCYVSYTETLAGNWSDWTSVGNIVVGGGEKAVDTSAVIPSGLNNCFIKIKLEKTAK